MPYSFIYHLTCAYIYMIVICTQLCVHMRVNQSIIYLPITHQAVKQHEHQDEMSRTPGTRCTYGCPYKPHKISKDSCKTSTNVHNIKGICTHFIQQYMSKSSIITRQWPGAVPFNFTYVLVIWCCRYTFNTSKICTSWWRHSLKLGTTGIVSVSWPHNQQIRQQILMCYSSTQVLHHHQMLLFQPGALPHWQMHWERTLLSYTV